MVYSVSKPCHLIRCPCRNRVLLQVIWECSAKVAVLHKRASILLALPVTVLLRVWWENKGDGPVCQQADISESTHMYLLCFMHQFGVYKFRRLKLVLFCLYTVCACVHAFVCACVWSSGTQFEIGAGGREEQDPFWSTTDSRHRAPRTWAIRRQGIFAAERPQWRWLPRRCIWWVFTLTNALGTRRRFCDKLPFTLSFTHRTLEYFCPPANAFGMFVPFPALSVFCWKVCIWCLFSKWTDTKQQGGTRLGLQYFHSQF